MYSELLSASHESLSYFNLHEYQGFTFSVNTTKKNNLDSIDLHIVKNKQSNPNGTYWLLSPSIKIMIHNIYDQLIHQSFVHYSYQCIQTDGQTWYMNWYPQVYPQNISTFSYVY